MPTYAGRLNRWQPWRDSTGATVHGLIHVNKSTSTDPLNTLMASRAFAALARSVLFVMTDPDDEKVRLLGIAKSNRGRIDVPTRSFQIVPAAWPIPPRAKCGRASWNGRKRAPGQYVRRRRRRLQAAATAPPRARLPSGWKTI
jgi:hypothetical protein